MPPLKRTCLSKTKEMNPTKQNRKKPFSHNTTRKQTIEPVEIDVHWFRRVFHTFAASFLIYYILPNEPWITTLKILIAITLVILVTILDIIRLRGKVKEEYFFGLRRYETKRPGSYLYFGIALLLLFLFFPQPIAIPCILCACFADPLIGELRYHCKKHQAALIGFILCFSFFLITWYSTKLWIALPVSMLGATGAIIGETKKFWLLDDDFMIQILPAILIFILWQGVKIIGVDILPSNLILPL